MNREHLPWTIEHLEGGDMALIKGRPSRDLVVAFSSYKQDWSEYVGEKNFDFINTVIFSACHGLLIRDVRNLWFLDGVRGVEGFDALNLKISEIASAYDRVVVIGSSMGGYAAILFGSMLAADQVVAIVPQIRIGLPAAPEMGDTRWHSHYSEISRLKVPPPYLSLDGLPLPSKTRFYAIYGDQDPYDNLHVALLKDTKFRVVTVQGADHNGAAIAALKNKLVEMAL